MKDKVANIYLGNGKSVNIRYDGALAAVSEVNTATVNAAIVAYWQRVGDGTSRLTLDEYLTAIEEATNSKRASIIQTALALHDEDRHGQWQ